MKRRSFVRKSRHLRYKKYFVISTEGNITEPDYFDGLKKLLDNVVIKCLYKVGKNSPSDVLERMRHFIDDKGLFHDDEAWLVVDTDTWTDGQLGQLLAWSSDEHRRYVAISNPKFEYWLLLHFEDRKGFAGSKRCSTQLRRYLSGGKNVDMSKIGMMQIEQAVSRAAKKCGSLSINTKPCCPGQTTVYFLVQRLLKANKI